ncbi:HAD hydrolase-like protein [uncultured Bacteroides sp.]|uniref:HAD hydrolase-like protein n=1 Tax=uncultured Bacteroides sp. TaxID=162156 RepID=UPI0026347B09|nr:HAD hydrolase-like protein [uncultured Bacteroides sp.]
MAIKNYKYLFFDLDGTLTKSGEGIMRSAQHALRHFGIDVKDWNTLRPFVGPPLEDSFKNFYHLTPEQAHEATKIYGERYARLGAFEAEPYEGVFEFLQKVKETGKVAVICTSKKIKIATTVIEHFKLAPYFDYIGARDEEGIIHTKADVIRHIISELGIKDTNEIVMIGDRMFDINGAKEVGLDSIGVLYGYGDKKELSDAGATYLAADFNELEQILL